MITINMITVACFQKSHGYERIINAIWEYKSHMPQANIILHMVGKGDELTKYKRIVEKKKLDDSVRFYGEKFGNELEEVYKKADIGLGCFGLYKRKINIISALKTREYLLHGLPVVTGCKEDIFIDQNFPFYLEFPNDSSKISIDRIVEFYTDITKKYTREEMQEQIVAFCKEKADMKVTMLPVINYLNEIYY